MRLVVVADIVKRVIAGLIGVIIISIMLMILSPVARDVIYAVFPPKNAPTVAYGKLEQLTFIEKKLINPNPKYTLNTKDGKLPTNLDAVMRVFKYKEPPFSFDAGKKAQADAKLLGFEDKDLLTDLKNDQYTWRDTNFGGVLDINITTKTIKLTTPINTLDSYYLEGKLTKAQAIKIATSLFGELDRFNDPLYQNGSQAAVLGKFNRNGIVAADATLEAQIARVDFFRSIFKIPILGPDAKKGNLHAFVRVPEKNSPQLNVPKLEAYYWEVDFEKFATYPVISVVDAWNQVAQNKGVVSSIVEVNGSPFEDYTPINVDEILINNIYLAYYDNSMPQQYLQPIYVFEGNFTGRTRGDITLYYPAIPAQYISK